MSFEKFQCSKFSVDQQSSKGVVGDHNPEHKSKRTNAIKAEIPKISFKYEAKTTAAGAGWNGIAKAEKNRSRQFCLSRIEIYVSLQIFSR
jgi:hypothetical protein